MSFCYNPTEIPQELNSCLYQLAASRTGSYMPFCLKPQNLSMPLGEDLLYLASCLSKTLEQEGPSSAFTELGAQCGTGDKQSNKHETINSGKSYKGR